MFRQLHAASSSSTFATFGQVSVLPPSSPVTRAAPLGGVDKMLHGMPKVLAEHDITFIPGFNEELAATAVMGKPGRISLPEPRPTTA